MPLCLDRLNTLHLHAAETCNWFMWELKILKPTRTPSAQAVRWGPHRPPTFRVDDQERQRLCPVQWLATDLSCLFSDICICQKKQVGLSYRGPSDASLRCCIHVPLRLTDGSMCFTVAAQPDVDSQANIPRAMHSTSNLSPTTKPHQANFSTSLTTDAPHCVLLALQPLHHT